MDDGRWTMDDTHNQAIVYRLSSIVSKRTIMSTKLRVGVIGCGGIASNHIRGYLDCGRYEIVGLADLEEAAMAEKDAAFEIAPQHYTDAPAAGCGLGLHLALRPRPLDDRGGSSSSKSHPVRKAHGRHDRPR